MRLRAELVEAELVRRLNRFVGEVAVAGERTLAHVPNSGRLRELLYPGARVLVAACTGRRKTAFDLLMAWSGGQLVSIDTRLPAMLIAEALEHGCLPELGPFTMLQREVRLGASRLDLFGDGPGGPCYIEVKSVTLVEGGVALFPDAPTARGVRHLHELMRAAEMGYRGTVVFVIQREDARVLRPHEATDPTFAEALRRASATVGVLAYACRVTRDEVVISHRVPVVL